MKGKNITLVLLDTNNPKYGRNPADSTLKRNFNREVHCKPLIFKHSEVLDNRSAFQAIPYIEKEKRLKSAFKFHKNFAPKQEFDYPYSEFFGIFHPFFALQPFGASHIIG